MANVTLGERYETYVKELVESGRYNSVSEVIRSGLRLLEDEEKIAQFRLECLQSEIQKGLDSGLAGPLNISDIKAKARDGIDCTRS
ncbi:MAG: antitoxin ParD1/3/4 [Phenylobacterium sp.]|jgi:antitoxin ParD1/3/4